MSSCYVLPQVRNFCRAPQIATIFVSFRNFCRGSQFSANSAVSGLLLSLFFSSWQVNFMPQHCCADDDFFIPYSIPTQKSLNTFFFVIVTTYAQFSLKLRPYGAIQMCILLFTHKLRNFPQFCRNFSLKIAAISSFFAAIFCKNYIYWQLIMS